MTIQQVLTLVVCFVVVMAIFKLAEFLDGGGQG